MEFNESKIEAILSGIFIHFVLGFVLLWCSGVLIAFVVGEPYHLAFDLYPFQILLKWAKWFCIDSPNISLFDLVENYGYLKFKVLAAFLFPFLVMIYPYFSYRNN